MLQAAAGESLLQQDSNKGMRWRRTCRGRRVLFLSSSAESLRVISKTCKLSGPRHARRAGRHGRPLPLAFTASELIAFPLWLCHCKRRTLHRQSPHRRLVANVDFKGDVCSATVDEVRPTVAPRMYISFDGGRAPVLIASCGRIPWLALKVYVTVNP